jgi:flagellar biogenesis protein FliO
MDLRFGRIVREALLAGAVVLFLSSLSLPAQDDAAHAPVGVTPQADPASHPDADFPSGETATAAPIATPPPPPAETIQETAEPATAGPAAGTWQETLSSIVRVGGAVGLLLSIALGGVWALRRLAPHRFPRKPVEKTLRLIETLSMGDKRSIAVVEVAGQRFLVGNTPNEITMLSPLDAGLVRESRISEGAGAAVSGAPVADRPAQGKFLNLILSERSTRARPPAKPGALSPDIVGKMRELREALES